MSSIKQLKQNLVYMYAMKCNDQIQTLDNLCKTRKLTSKDGGGGGGGGGWYNVLCA